MKKLTVLFIFFFLGCVKTEIEPNEKLPINFIGDSLTAGVADYTYPGQLIKILPNRTIYNIGIGGQNAEQIAARQGGLGIYIKLHNNSFSNLSEIPIDSLVSTVGGVSKSNYFLSTAAFNGEVSIDGSINGVKCTITRRTFNELVPPFTEFYYIKPKNATNAKIPPFSQFIPDQGFKQDSCVSVIWMGRNNDLSTIASRKNVFDIIKNSIDFNKAKKFIVLGMLKHSKSYIGTTNYANDQQMDILLKNMYPNNYIDISPPTDQEMDDIGYVPSIQDKLDITNGVIPLGMRSDGLHLNRIGNSIIANRVYKKLKELNY
ncbi:MAG: hypothetical protein QM541_00165 [Flavobacterium sp.]|nr:hypothetical protein [Flavobacterium sp.]